ncbi:MAG TPA: glutamine amidotransferase [Longimicrobiales bacterium]
MPSVFESVFEFLFKYRPLVYSRGDFAFAAPSSVITFVVIALVVAIPVSLTYAWVTAESTRRDRIMLATSRAALLVLLGFCLMRPSLSLTSLVERRGYVAVLVDDSRSMSVKDDGTRTRADAARDWIGNTAEVRKRLEDRFRVRYYRFAESAAQANPDSLRQTGGTTDIGGALTHVAQDMAGLPLAGVVMISDGADNSQRDLSESLLPLRAAGVPVFTAAVGSEIVQRDVQVSRVSVPASVLKDATVMADVELRYSGYAGGKVRVEVEDAGRLLTREEVTLPRGTDYTNVKLSFTANESGARQLRVRVAPLEDEKLVENNERPALLEVRNRREKVLLVEGEPRFEGKFIRRAVTDEKNLHLVVLQRTAPEKFLRLDVDSAAELASGFPKSRAELFSYRALILGSIEASFFTHEQLQMIAEFVSKRGGGLLMLGGANSFAEGGWAGTPVAEVLPVELERGGGARKFIPLQVRPTRAGVIHPVTRLASTELASNTRWQTLPQVSTANVVGPLKRGATALLSTSTGATVMAQHRYGRGVALAFTPQDSWLWQMHNDIPVEDQTHETFWRQVLRYLVQDAADPIRVAAPAMARVQQPMDVTALIEDTAFAGVNDAEVTARVRSPSGAEYELPATWSGRTDGEFNASATLREPGLHEISIEARRGGQVIGTGKAFVNASSADLEFFDPQMRASTLRRIAEESGGRFYNAQTIGSIADDIGMLGRGETVREQRELWDMPLIFILLLGLACAEWLYRRKKGLV